VKLVLVQLPLLAGQGTHNWDLVRRALERRPLDLCPHDVVVLPELLDQRPEREAYEDAVRSLARGLGCHVVGGSHYEGRGDAKVNSGIVADAAGRIVSRYEKLRPYGSRRDGVAAGRRPGDLMVGGEAPGAVAGFADPTRTEPRQLFTPVGPGGLAAHVLDFDALERFRSDRVDRGFLWRPPSEESVTLR
jgi:predicted amidohydrolase